MSTLRGWLIRASGLFGGQRRDREFAEELESHVGLAADDHRRSGMTPGEARRQALIEIGGTQSAKEAYREQGGVPWLDHFLRDLRYGARMLRRNPGYTAVALLALALGIGANTALFSVVYSVLLRPLPYADASRLVVLRQQARSVNVEDMAFSVKEIEDFRAQAHTVDDIEEYHGMYFVLLGRQPDRVQTGVVSAGFFPMLGVKPLLGRLFQPADDKIGAPPVLVLSYEYWQRAFGGDPNVVGKTFRMNDKVHTVVGVLPAIPQYPRENDVYMPVSACPFRSNAKHMQDRDMRMMRLLAHLKPGATPAAADREMRAIAGAIQRDNPKFYPASIGYSADASGLSDQLTKRARPILMLLLATTGLVLLICCTNVANLALARMTRREHEFAVRSALGASNGRLARQVLTESAVLGLGGGILGLILASFSLRLLVRFVSMFTTRAGEVTLSTPVLLFTVALSLATSLLFGVLPALTARRGMSALKLGSNTTTVRVHGNGFRNGLIVAEVALSFVMLTAAGLMLRTLIKLNSVNAGYDSDNVVSINLPFDWSKYNTDQRTRTYEDRILESVSRLPGVTAAGMTSAVPLDESGPSHTEILIDGHATDSSGPKPLVNIMQVSPDAFRTLGIALLHGRGFLGNDRENTEQVAVISRSMAKHYWGTTDPVGHHLGTPDGKHTVDIVGVVADVHQYGLDKAVEDTVYVPLAQSPGGGSLVLRTLGDPMNSVNQVRDAIRQIDPEQPIAEVKTLEELRENSIVQQRITATLLGFFAALALIIAATGLAGVTAFLVSRRTREIGIRLALGANVREIILMVLSHGARLLLLGTAIGVAASFIVGRALQGLLFEVKPLDLPTLLLVTFVLIGASLGASYIPARRATRVDPLQALRCD
ncbi:MAG: ADOP family duplicated permease [Terriglobales bacterium]